MKIICGVYGIFNTHSNECLYVGQSKDISSRWRRHISDLQINNHRCKLFNEWFNANTSVESLLTFKVLEECIDDDLVKNICEIKWFNELSPLFFGKVPSTKDKWAHSDITKEKIRIAATKPMHKKNCLNCDSIFEFKRPLSKTFCSNLCMLKFYKKDRIFDSNTVKELRQFLPVSEIAKMFNCSERLVYYRLKE